MLIIQYTNPVQKTLYFTQQKAKITKSSVQLQSPLPIEDSTG